MIAASGVAAIIVASGRQRERETGSRHLERERTT